MSGLESNISGKKQRRKAVQDREVAGSGQPPRSAAKKLHRDVFPASSARLRRKRAFSKRLSSRTVQEGERLSSSVGLSWGRRVHGLGLYRAYVTRELVRGKHRGFMALFGQEGGGGADAGV